MPNMIDIDLGRPARRLRVNTLSRLRWLALTGQAGAVLFTHFALGFPLPLMACLGVIALSVVCNTWLRFHYPLTHRLNDRAATALLAYDLLQLSALLYLTGGLENPFSMLFLAPVMISAASLPPSRTVLLGGLAVVAATFLVRWHEPLPWHPGEEMRLPVLFSAGIWCAVVMGVGFIGVYASRVAEEARQLSDALAATELVLAREQHLTQLDGLAAAAAHELGTPLATITLVVREMLGLVAKAGATIDVAQIADDIRLLDQEAQRCRAILGKLTSLGTEDAGPLGEMTLSHLVEDVAGPQRNFDVAVTVTPIGFDEEPVCARNPAILYGLGNLVENAVDFARHRVQIDAHWTPDIVSVTVRDDGPGFAAEILSKLGEPYVTTRRAGGRAKSATDSGLGLGLFIAKTLLERSGALVATSNASAPETGAVVTVTWPRDVFERGLARAKPNGPKRQKGPRAPGLF
ncbi:ActS/PrrB/RegB family redox-sensitive histidine kinase [Lichenibacterium dinghuense]|uniref:ActS/PrrB/RegB family redox-sensitive histidine kinase n=1 Tax=Lichenibacterium dinghuense TaxID=2895977 RepID=UPI001EFFAA5A|nr:ActS/PrrB/RegB family redox-sensitive histidine kinase [Lichenibacterium sp. 6Y81]